MMLYITTNAEVQKMPAKIPQSKTPASFSHLPGFLFPKTAFRASSVRLGANNNAVGNDFK